MKNKLLLLLVLPLIQLPVQINADAALNNSNSTIKVTKKTTKNLCNNSKTIFNIEYPQIEKLSDKKVENKINTYLKKEFLSQKNGKCSDNNLGEKYQENISYQTKLNFKGLISFFYDSSGNLERAAHPSNFSTSLNLSSATGNKIEFKNLFLKNSKYLSKITEQIKLSLQKQNITDMEINLLTKDPEFYLTDKKLVVINIFSGHAMQSVEAPIDYSSIMEIIDKNGPLKSLLKI